MFEKNYCSLLSYKNFGWIFFLEAEIYLMQAFWREAKQNFNLVLWTHYVLKIFESFFELSNFTSFTFQNLLKKSQTLELLKSFLKFWSFKKLF